MTYNPSPGGGGGAPTDATYITQTANATLSAEQALAALATGVVKVTNGTGALSTAVAGTDYAAVSHAHIIGDTTGLQSALDGKTATGHSHAISDTTGLQTALDGKTATGHTHTLNEVSTLLTEAGSVVTLGNGSLFAGPTGNEISFGAVDADDPSIYASGGTDFILAGGAVGFWSMGAGAKRWDINSSGHFVPGANNTYDMGASGTRIKKLWVVDIDISGTGGGGGLSQAQVLARGMGA